MLPQAHRLRLAADLAIVQKQGRVWRHPFCILLVRRGSSQVSRFAFVASRRVGNAVVRNRAKRLLREAVRTHLDDIEPGWDCVWIARPRLPKASFAEVETAVLQLLGQSKLLAASERTRKRT